MAPQVRVRTQSGHWLVLHASRVSGKVGQGPIAIVIEAARPIEIAPLIAQAYDLSPRERAVTQLVLRGLSTAEIAAEIHLCQPTTIKSCYCFSTKCCGCFCREWAVRCSSRHFASRFVRANSGNQILSSCATPTTRAARIAAGSAPTW